MNRGLSTLALVALLGAGIAAGVGLAARLDSGGASDPGSIDAALTLQSAYNRASTIATQAVVHITTSDESADDNRSGTNLGDTVASGVIVSPAGHIVTNYHVVRESRACLVRFVDGSEFEAKVTGRDPESDLAVLKIDTGGRALTPMVFADSDRVRVGDIVFAVGSPFGYTHTVTSGIVSAKHRRLEFGKPYEDYLQTDAAINPGNSGGALVNLKGELVGLNTAIVSRNRASDGVGLAIASNVVKWVQERLVRDGVVRRGYLGIGPFDLDPRGLRNLPQRVAAGWTPEELASVIGLARAQTAEEVAKTLGLAEPSGVLILSVTRGSPAEDVPLRFLDVMTEFDGRPVRNRHELFFQVAELAPGRRVKLKFVRGGKTKEAEVVLADRPPPFEAPQLPLEIPK